MAVHSARMQLTGDRVALSHVASDVNPGQSIMVKNLDEEQSVMLGGDEVTWSNGWPLGPLEVVSLSDLASQELLYGVAAQGATVEVALLQVGV